MDLNIRFAGKDASNPDSSASIYKANSIDRAAKNSAINATLNKDY